MANSPGFSVGGNIVATGNLVTNNNALILSDTTDVSNTIYWTIQNPPSNNTLYIGCNNSQPPGLIQKYIVNQYGGFQAINGDFQAINSNYNYVYNDIEFTPPVLWAAGKYIHSVTPDTYVVSNCSIVWTNTSGGFWTVTFPNPNNLDYIVNCQVINHLDDNPFITWNKIDYESFTRSTNNGAEWDICFSVYLLRV